MSPTHPTAEAGFGSAAESYERGRPSYPQDAVATLAERIDIGAGRRLLDLAAGTGKLTRLLQPLGAELTALEPVAEMRRVLVRQIPGLRVVGGSAESIPLADGSLDAVTVAQAFHWFDPLRAPAEIHRVLAPAGGLGLIWNTYDLTTPWVAELSRIVHRHRPPGVPWYESWTWQAPEGLFSPLERSSFPHAQRVDAGRLVDRVLSTSYIAVLDADSRSELRADVLRLVAEFGDREFDLPYRTDLFCCRRT